MMRNQEVRLGIFEGWMTIHCELKDRYIRRIGKSRPGTGPSGWADSEEGGLPSPYPDEFSSACTKYAMRRAFII